MNIRTTILSIMIGLTSIAVSAIETATNKAPNLTRQQDTWDFRDNPGPVEQVYKWQDAEGTWHYSQSKPGKGAAVTPVATMTVDASTNIIKSMSDEEINQVLGKVNEIMHKRDQADKTKTATASVSSSKTGAPGCGTVFGVDMPQWMEVPLSVSCSDLENMRVQLESIQQHREQYVKALEHIHSGK